MKNLIPIAITVVITVIVIWVANSYSKAKDVREKREQEFSLMDVFALMRSEDDFIKATQEQYQEETYGADEELN